jgi:hypothetical protein
MLRDRPRSYQRVNKKACWRLNQQAFTNPAEVQTELARTDAFDQLAADIQYPQQSS